MYSLRSFRPSFLCIAMPVSVDRRSGVSIHPYPAFVEGLQPLTLSVLGRAALHLLPSSVKEGGKVWFFVGFLSFLSVLAGIARLSPAHIWYAKSYDRTSSPQVFHLSSDNTFSISLCLRNRLRESIGWYASGKRYLLEPVRDEREKWKKN